MHPLLDCYRDPMFLYYAVGGVGVSLVAFLIIAVPMTVLAWLDPPALQKYRIQTRRPRAQELVAPALRRVFGNNALVFAALVVTWPLTGAGRVHAGPLPPAWLIAI